MKLFFETSSQVYSFLAAVPVGFGAAMCMDFGSGGSLWRTALDLLLMLLSGFSLLFLVFALQEEGLRLYHLLGIITGTVLYLRGIGSLKRGIAALFSTVKKKRGTAVERQEFPG